VICEMLAATIDCLVFFGLSALRFIVAVCFFFNVSIRLFGPLSAMCPHSFCVRQAPPSKTEPSLRGCGVKSVVSSEEHSECCETETENAFTAHERRRAAYVEQRDGPAPAGFRHEGCLSTIRPTRGATHGLVRPGVCRPAMSCVGPPHIRVRLRWQQLGG